MQERWPVGAGPSGKTWPRWAPHWAHWASTRCIPWLESLVVSTFSSLAAAPKLAHPAPRGARALAAVHPGARSHRVADVLSARRRPEARPAAPGVELLLRERLAEL